MTHNNKHYKDILEGKLFSAEVICNTLLDMFKNSKHDPYAIVQEFFNIHSKKYGRYVDASYHADYYADYYAKSRLRYECDFDTIIHRSDMRDVVNSYLLEKLNNNNPYMVQASYHNKATVKIAPILSYHIADQEEFYVLSIGEQTEEYTNLDKISARLKAEKINSCIWDAGTSNLPPPKLDGIMWEEEY